MARLKQKCAKESKFTLLILNGDVRRPDNLPMPGARSLTSRRASGYSLSHIPISDESSDESSSDDGTGTGRTISFAPATPTMLPHGPANGPGMSNGMTAAADATHGAVDATHGAAAAAAAAADESNGPATTGAATATATANATAMGGGVANATESAINPATDGNDRDAHASLGETKTAGHLGTPAERHMCARAPTLPGAPQLA